MKIYDEERIVERQYRINKIDKKYYKGVFSTEQSSQYRYASTWSSVTIYADLQRRVWRVLL